MFLSLIVAQKHDAPTVTRGEMTTMSAYILRTTKKQVLTYPSSPSLS